MYEYHNNMQHKNNLLEKFSMGRKQFIGSDIGSQDFFKDQTRLVFTRDFRLNLFVRISVIKSTQRV